MILRYKTWGTKSSPVIQTKSLHLQGELARIGRYDTPTGESGSLRTIIQCMPPVPRDSLGSIHMNFTIFYHDGHEHWNSIFHKILEPS